MTTITDSDLDWFNKLRSKDIQREKAIAEELLESLTGHRQNYPQPNCAPVHQGLRSPSEIRDEYVRELDITIRFLQNRLKSLGYLETGA
jgi:hypothetical protein